MVSETLRDFLRVGFFKRNAKFLFLTPQNQAFREPTLSFPE